MTHFVWQWSYTVYSFLVVLSSFALAGVALILHSPRMRHTPGGD